MTTRILWVDGSTATFQKSFVRNKDWLATATDASVWLLEMSKREFSKHHMYVFLSDSSPCSDNKINRYRKFSRRSSLKEGVFQDCPIIDEGMEEGDNSLFFWTILVINKTVLPPIIDYLRSDRGSFIFFTKQLEASKNILIKIVKSRAGGFIERIDQPQVIENLIAHNTNPVRIWGQFDDNELWVEIWGTPSH